MAKPFVVTFAGPPGTGKTPIAFYLSHTLNLPIIQMDAIRLEVREDLLKDDEDHPAARNEFLKRAVDRYQALLARGWNFIDDSSADRSWKQRPDDQYYQLRARGYDFFIVSMDLSKEFVAKLHTANRSVLAASLDDYYKQHQEFLRLYSNDVGLHITDTNYPDRIKLAEEAVRAFIAGHAASARS